MKAKNLFFVCAAFPALGTAQSFSIIGDLPGGVYHSAASGVSNTGVAVGHSMAATATGVAWSQNGGLKSLDVFGGLYSSSHANAISGDGLTIVGTSTKAGSPPATKAMVWRGNGFTALSDLPGGDDNAGINSVSADGNVAIGYGTAPSTTLAVRWTMANGVETNRQQLLDLAGGANRGQAIDVSADGKNVVGYGTVDGGFQTAVIWKDGGTTPTALGTIANGTQQSFASSISADGNWVVGRVIAADGTHAFRWSEATGMVSLGDFAGSYLYSQANAVSGDGKAVVGYGTPANAKPTPFYWSEETGMLELETFLQNKGLDLSGLNGGRLYIASDISADGRYIVGQVAYQNGTYSGFVADLGAAPVPEPATLGALAIGSLGLLRRARKRRA